MIWHLRKKLDRAKWIDDQIEEDWDNWYELTQTEKTLWLQRQPGQLEEQLNEIRQTAPPDKYLGAVETMARRAAQDLTESCAASKDSPEA